MEFILVIVDDDEICLKVHKKIFEITKFHNAPQTFNSVQSALNFFAGLTDKTKPILLVLDINMPTMDGWELLNIIRQEDFDKEIYVVMASSSVDKSDKNKAFSFSKVIDFIEKPFSMSVAQRLKLILPWMQDGST